MPVPFFIKPMIFTHSFLKVMIPCCFPSLTSLYFLVFIFLILDLIYFQVTFPPAFSGSYLVVLLLFWDQKDYNWKERNVHVTSSVMGILRHILSKPHLIRKLVSFLQEFRHFPASPKFLYYKLCDSSLETQCYAIYISING